MTRTGFEIVYFVTSVSAKDKNAPHNADVIKALQKLQLEIINTDSSVKNNLVKIHQQISKADYFIAEVTEPSTSIGYEIGYAITLSKPILLLQRSNKLDHAKMPFINNPTKLVTYVKYDKSNLLLKIEHFLKKAKKGIFIKRLPIEFTQNQVNYVRYRQVTNSKKRSFNSIIREIIEEKIVTDKVYKRNEA